MNKCLEILQGFKIKIILKYLSKNFEIQEIYNFFLPNQLSTYKLNSVTF